MLVDSRDVIFTHIISYVINKQSNKQAETECVKPSNTCKFLFSGHSTYIRIDSADTK